MNFFKKIELFFWFCGAYFIEKKVKFRSYDYDDAFKILIVLDKKKK